MLDAQMIADVRHVATRVSGLLGSPVYGRDDVAQSILLRIVERTTRFDPRLASARTWARLIARHEAASMIAKARAEKRDCRVCTKSLDEMIETGDGAGTVERVTTISADIYGMQTGRQTRPASELQLLAIDLTRVLDQLPPELVSVARLLAEGETPAEAATILNISRATIYRRMVRIRTAFRDAGFQSYARLQEAA
jgi:RNA polymerase sigma-70 factor (ECF subfamily)